jgi:hypothetical protein
MLASGLEGGRGGIGVRAGGHMRGGLIRAHVG